MRILLVDDRRENLATLEGVLEPLGHELVAVTSGDDALGQLLRHDFALVLLDVMMPGLDGYATADMIRSRSRTSDIPIIFVTAMNHDVEHELRGYASGGIDFITKPFDAHVLRSKVSVLLELHASRERLRSQATELRRRLEERDRAERALARRTTELARSNMELEQFTHLVSRDMRDPLDTLSGFLRLAAERSTDDVRPFVDRALAQASRLRALLDGAVRYTTDGVRPPDGVVDLDLAVDQALGHMDEAITRSGCRLTRVALPAVRGELSELTEVFEHLFSNAVAFRAERPLTVEIGSQQSTDEWLVTVRDNGMGFDPEDASRIFTLFQRLQPRERGSGTGVGLAICRKIVERHGGRIWAESERGSGATFFLTFPRIAS